MSAIAIPARASVSLQSKVTAPSKARSIKVLCATDLWPRSDAALERALAVSRLAKAKPLLLHVVGPEGPLRVLGRRADLAHSALQWRLRQLQCFDSQPAISVRIGNPHETIARVARSWNADLLLLGTYRARKADWLFGTTAERIADAARCPVLTVNSTTPQPYSRVRVVAHSLDGAAALIRAAEALRVWHPAKPGYRVFVPEPRLRRDSHPTAAAIENLGVRAGLDPSAIEFIDLAHTSLRAELGSTNVDASELTITALTRWSPMTRAVGASMANLISRKAVGDVLIVPSTSLRF